MVIEVPYTYKDAWGREHTTILRYERDVDPHTQHVRWSRLPGGPGEGADPAPQRPPRVVAIGGGTGLPVVLRALRRWLGTGPGPAGRHALTAIVAVTDDGGSSGSIRSACQVTPPGDIRNCLVALAEDASPFSRVFQYRFDGGDALEGHTLGNLFLAASARAGANFMEAVDLAQRILGTSGRVYPCTLADVRLRAEFVDGSVAEGETNLRAQGRPIRRLSLVPPDPPAVREAVEALRLADLVVIGPGSLYTSLLAVLAIPDLAQAMREVRAPRVLVLNLMTEPGETGGFSGPDHLRALDEHLGGRAVDAVLANDAPFSQELLDRYAAQGAHPVAIDDEGFRGLGVPLIKAGLAVAQDPARHDPEALAAVLAACCTARLRT
ncbi:MAG TPA: uridine diphosphate-N-acetylglucosamine-binding protein YvcK [Candidatus Methylomirabilis sp.]